MGCEEELKTMGILGLGEAGKVEMIAEIFRFVVKLRERICGAVVVKVSSGWIRGAVERVRG